MKKIFLILLTALLPLLCCAENYIEIKKSEFRLYVKAEDGSIIYECPIAYGRNKGNKQRRGDCKTPEGTFKITQIVNSSNWSHDFGDGKGEIPHAYGPYFMRLGVPQFYHIGIHGTCFPESIGKNATEGCVRLRNEDLLQLVNLVHVGTKCTIYPE